MRWLFSQCAVIETLYVGVGNDPRERARHVAATIAYPDEYEIAVARKASRPSPWRKHTPSDQVVCGTHAMYRRGCRCADCRAAAARARHEQRQRARARANRSVHVPAASQGAQ